MTFKDIYLYIYIKLIPVYDLVPLNHINSAIILEFVPSTFDKANFQQKMLKVWLEVVVLFGKLKKVII